MTTRAILVRLVAEAEASGDWALACFYAAVLTRLIRESQGLKP